MSDETLLRAMLQDQDRLEALRRTRLLDTPPEEAFDRLTRLVCRLLDVPTALVSLVEADRQFFKSAIGLPQPWLLQTGDVPTALVLPARRGYGCTVGGPGREPAPGSV